MRLLSIVTLAACGTMISCGTSDKAKSCQVSFGKIAWSADTGNQREGNYRADLSSECQELLAQPGDINVTLHSEAPVNAEAYWSVLQSGERSYNLGKQVAAFTSTTFDSYFSSTSLPKWRAPWADKPTTVTLGLQAPLGFKDADLPTKIQLTLAL